MLIVKLCDLKQISSLILKVKYDFQKSHPYKSSVLDFLDKSLSLHNIKGEDYRKHNLTPVLMHANTGAWEVVLSVMSLGTHCLLQVLGENVLWISQYQRNFK